MWKFIKNLILLAAMVIVLCCHGGDIQKWLNHHFKSVVTTLKNGIQVEIKTGKSEPEKSSWTNLKINMQNEIERKELRECP